MFKVCKMTKGSSYKSSTNSIQNALILLLFIVGLFIMYRYVKTLETEMKLLHNHIIELTEKTHQLDNEQQSIKASISNTSNLTCEMAPAPKKKAAHVTDNVAPQRMDEEFDEPDEQDDNESIQSDDITNILRKVIGGVSPIDIDILNPENIAMNHQPQNCTLEEINEDDAEEEQDVENETPVQEDINEDEQAIDTLSLKSGNRTLNIDDDITPSASDVSNELFKKTNEELKTILKSHGLSTKGAKSELVDRIVSNNI